MVSIYSRGAEWRKWDLHVHTPFSIYQRFGENNEGTWRKYIADLEALPQEYSVLGINDYLFLDGYSKLKDEQNQKGKLLERVLLPVVEFRIEKFAGIQFGSLKRINLHVIFSDELSVETIKSQFLNTLEQSYTLESGEAWTRAITPESVSELGASIKSTVPENELPNYDTDLVEGFNNLNVKEDQIFSSLDKDCFKGKYLIAIGKTEWAELKWTDASIATKKSIINSADIVFTASESVKNFKKSKDQLKKQGVNDLLIDCSDAHYYSDSQEKDRIGNCFTWLKADPTFDGLKQTLNEPNERIFIGDKPPVLERVSRNRTKYINSLSINPVAGYDDHAGTWFKEINVPFNKELVAIIGNKGSGKSAIADILSLCSNYYNDSDFSFLTSRKFREKQGKIAKNFIAKLFWESGVKDSKKLDESPAETEILNVKYIPQGQFERLTNEINTAKEFQEEIESVVFSHIPESERLGAKSFSELVDIKTHAVETDLRSLTNDIEDINGAIIELERKKTVSYHLEIENKIATKRKELEALVEPVPVSDPNQVPVKKQKCEAVNNKITAIKEDISKIEFNIEKAETDKKTALKDLQKLGDVKQDIQLKVTEFSQYISEKKDDLFVLGINIENLISLKTDFTELDAKVSSINLHLQITLKNLGETESNDDIKSLVETLEEKQGELKTETSKLDLEQKAYQDYLSAIEIWQKDQKAVIGSEETFDSLDYYKSEIKYLETELTTELESKYEQRRNKVREIFDKKQEIIGVYKEAKTRLNKVIENNAKTLKDYKVEVDASLVKKSDFNAKFLEHILQNKMGSFHSKDGGEKLLKTLLSEIDFDDKECVIACLDNIVEALHYDKRDGQNNSKRDVTEQVKDQSLLYNYLFSFEFIGFNYQLKHGQKVIEQLSPGERGALLLVFYLLLDKNDIPLIIDQPEDNLDNHSVATVLVPFIRAAKQKRQIIMVTHNPNLAVVADAEQIIYVDIDKENNHKFSTISGSIENKEVNQKIVKVLEGTMPAFNNRKRKYFE
ncbi:MAG: AAA family ATPase [Deltaproteobacteria bacterium]|jgi:ABC-type lipoprotein export system ATPase subunit|nr:AAA family ATPase [Deltaproteobacteria bacterium]